MEPNTTAIATALSVLGGMGFPGIVIGGLVWLAWSQSKRINELTDKLIAINGEQTKAAEAMTGALTRITDTLVRGGKADT